MTLKPGQSYKNRSGGKVHIYEERDGEFFGVSSLDGGLYPMSWLATGVNLANNDRHDIVDKWIEKPIVNFNKLRRFYTWAAMDENGNWNLFINKPEIDEQFQGWFDDLDSGAEINSTVFEYSGDWKDSLIEL